MAKKQQRWYILIRRRDFDHLAAWQVLDILRYESCRVEEHAWLADGTFDGFVVLSKPVELSQFNSARLASFHLRIVGYALKSEYNDVAREEAHRWKKEELERDEARKQQA